MEGTEPGGKIHALVIPFPLQGHINPLLQFSKRLASKGLKVTFVTTTSISKTMAAKTSGGGSIKIEPIPDDSEEGAESSSLEADLENFTTRASQSLKEIIEKQIGSGDPPKVLVYDSIIPWALDIAEIYGLQGAAFFTVSSAVTAIFYNVNQGSLKIPTGDDAVSIPSMPLLEAEDLPSFVRDTDSYPFILSLVLQQFPNFQKPDWILFNTFNKLEEQVINWMASQRSIMTIGPTVPSMYLDKRLEDDKDYGLNLFNPNVDECIKWLDTKENNSVVYVSFGSMATLREEQMEELAWGLKRSDSYFLWVVRESEGKNLPSNFMDEKLAKGLVVTWCPQLDVLAHKATGCFVTHCGWNSTLEALGLGVPMVAMPQWSDQPTNAKFVVDVWQVGVRVKRDENGIVKQEEIELCIREIMEGEKGKEIKRNAAKWMKLANEAVNEGGSSDKNIDEFVTNLACTKP